MLDFSYGLELLLDRDRQVDPAEPARQPRLARLRQRRARAARAAFPDNKIVRQGIYTPDVGYYAGRDHRLRPRCSTTTWRPARDGRRARPELGGGVRQPLRQARRRRQRAALLQGAVRRRDSARFFRIGGSRRARSGQRLPHPDRHAEGAARHRRQRRLPVHRQPPAVASRTSTRHSGRDEGRFFEGRNTENLFDYRNNRLQFIEEGLISNAVGGEHFFAGPRQQPHRLARELRARDPRRAGSARDAVPAAVHRRHAAAEPTPFVLADESQSGFRMFNDARRRHDRRARRTGACSAPPAAGRRSSSSASTTSIAARDFQSRRFRFIPIVVNKDGAAADQPDAGSPRSSTPSANIGTAFRFNEETRPVDAYDGDQTTTAGYGMVDIALSAAHPPDRRRARRALRPDGRHLRSVRPVRAHDHGREQEHRRLPGHQLRAVARGRTRTCGSSYSTTVNRPEFRELAAFEFTDVVGNRAVRGNPDLERALIQNVDGRWEMFPRRPRHRRRQRVLQVLRQADRARRHRRRPADRHVPERRHGPQLRHRAGGGPRARRAASSSTPTTRSSTRRSRCCPSSARCRRRSSGRSPASRRTCST